MKTFVKHYPVRFGEIDHAGVMYYPSLFDRMHRSFEDFWSDALGRSYPEVLGEDGIGFPVIDIHATFKAPFRFGDSLRMEIDVLRLGTKSITFRFRLGSGDEPGVRAQAEMVTAVIDMKTFGPRPLPDSYRSLLEGYQAAT